MLEAVWQDDLGGVQVGWMRRRLAGGVGVFSLRLDVHHEQTDAGRIRVEDAEAPDRPEASGGRLENRLL